MPQFAILRMEKLKTLGAVAGSLSHTYRTRETLNAVASRTAENEHTDHRPQEVMQALKARLPVKRRKDAVLGLEYFVGASPEWFVGKTRQQEDAYFRQAVDWLKARHGADNVVGWSIHRDESSPHLVAYIVPLDDSGKLNAKKWTGGAAALSRMQTDFAKKVGAQHGLERGIEGSKATHQKVKDWYAQIEKPGEHVTITKDDIKPHFDQNYGDYESSEQVAERLTASVQAAYAPAVEKAKVFESERRRASEMVQTAQSLTGEKKALEGRIGAMESVFAPLMELAELAQGEFEQLMNKAKERVRSLKTEREKRIEAERQRVAEVEAKKHQIAAETAKRIKGLPALLKGVGAVLTFGEKAAEAIKRYGGDASKVSWISVEAATVNESMQEHGQPAETVIDAINRYSPGRADPASHQQLHDAVMRAAPGCARVYEQRLAERGHRLD